MGSFESKQHSPGVMIVRVKGNIGADDLEEWRDDLEKFVRENKDIGACGMLIDTCQVDSFSPDTIDALFELLTDPEEVIRDVKVRFAFIGVKPFTQRFFRETMPLDEIRHIRARFFHEVAEAEALAWLTAMVSSTDGGAERQAAAKAAPQDKPVEPPKQEVKPAVQTKPDSKPSEPIKTSAGEKPAAPVKAPELALSKPTAPKTGTGPLKDRLKPK